MTFFFVTGIDTGIGKTIVTGMAARHFHKQGKKVLTQKLVQTGQLGFVSEDILEHRRLMGIAPLPGDLPLYPPDGALTCPYSFEYPASPHLAANLERRVVDPEILTHTADTLQKQYDLLFLEGIGGFMTPLTPLLLTADYIEQRGYPIILVTSGRLGSINHTLLTVEAIQRRNLSIVCLVFNKYPALNETISEASLELFRGICPHVVLLPQINPDKIPEIDFSCLLNNF
jgi:dethiobiotin synthetase